MNAVTRIFGPAVAVLLLFSAFATPAYSQVSVQSGSWSSASTWTTPPVNNGQAVVNGGYEVTYGEGDSYAGNPAWWAGLAVGADATWGGTAGAGTLNITGGTLATGAWFTGYFHPGTINLSSGVLDAAGDRMWFGWTTSSTLNVSGGTLNMAGSGENYNFGHGAASTMNITGGVANLSGAINVLNASQINVDGGALNITQPGSDRVLVTQGSEVNHISGTSSSAGSAGFWLGSDGTSGTLNVSGGTWQQDNFVRFGVFGGGDGTINQTGGTFEMGSTFEVWATAGSTNAYNLSGGTFRVTGAGVAFNVASGVAEFNITGTSGNVTMDTPNNFTVPNTSVFNNAAATLSKTGSGTLTFGNASQLDVRNGSLSMQAGTIETASSLVIGSGGGTVSGTMGGGTLRTGFLGASDLIVGYGGTGSLTQSNGTVDVGAAANAVFGWESGGVGAYTLSGGTFSAAGAAFIGYVGGSGTVTINGGSFSAGSLGVGGNSAAAGTLNLNGGTVAVSGDVVVANGGAVNVNSGGSIPAANVTVTSNGQVTFNGGAGNAASNFLVSGGGVVDVNGQSLANGSWANLVAQGVGGVLSNSSASAATIANGNTLWIWDGGQNLTIDTPAGSLDIASLITSAGQTTATGIIKTGTGTLILSGFQKTYTGTTAVNAGSLLVNSDNSAATGAVTVAAGALLGGTGVVGGATTVDGTLSPGNSAGVLSVASLALGGSSTSLFEINGTTRGTAYDGVNITGATAPTYGGTLSLLFGNASPFADNTTFDLFSFTGSPTGAFSSVTSTGFYAGTWTLSEGTWSLESGGQTLSFNSSTGDIIVVPEPGALALAGLGIAAAVWARRRR